jgi:ABC-2 type transport system permease protein
MNVKRSYAIFVRQLYLLGNNPTRLAGNFVWLTISIIQWGFISKYLGTLGKANFNFITVILGALILWEFLSRIQQGMMMAFLEDIWSNNLINYFASPLRVSEYTLGLVASSIVTALLGFLIMAIIAGLGFGYDIFIIGLSMIPFMAILFIFGMALGLFTCAAIFRLGPTAEWLGLAVTDDPLPYLGRLLSHRYPAPLLRLGRRTLPPCLCFRKPPRPAGADGDRTDDRQ